MASFAYTDGQQGPALGGGAALFGIIAFFALLIFVPIIEFLELYPHHLASTAVILLCGGLIIRRHSALSFRFLSFLIIFYPALAPAYAWDLMGVELFSWAAQSLQRDLPLVTKTVYLFALGAITFTIFALPGSRVGQSQVNAAPLQFATLDSGILCIIGFCTLISAYIIDSGPTILTSRYSEVLEGRIESSPLVVFVVSIFGGLWSLLFIFGRHRRTILWSITFLAVLWLFLHARRVEVFGIALVLLMWARYAFGPRRLILIGLSFILVQFAVEVVRNFGVIQYFVTGVDAYTQEILTGFGQLSGLPGGASNVLLSGLHLVDVKDSGTVSGMDTLTILEWPRAMIPNTIWRLLDAPPVLSEHDLIYSNLELSYVGGMPLLVVFYLNGGVLLVLIFGAFHGFIAGKVENVFNKNLLRSFNIGGNAAFFMASVFILYQFRYHWYNPQTMVRCISYSILLILLVSAFLKVRKILGVNQTTVTQHKGYYRPRSERYP